MLCGSSVGAGLRWMLFGLPDVESHNDKFRSAAGLPRGNSRGLETVRNVSSPHLFKRRKLYDAAIENVKPGSCTFGRSRVFFASLGAIGGAARCRSRSPARLGRGGEDRAAGLSRHEVP